MSEFALRAALYIRFVRWVRSAVGCLELIAGCARDCNVDERRVCRARAGGDGDVRARTIVNPVRTKPLYDGGDGGRVGKVGHRVQGGRQQVGPTEGVSSERGKGSRSHQQRPDAVPEGDRP